MIDFFLFKSFLVHRLAKALYYLQLVLLVLLYLAGSGTAFYVDANHGTDYGLVVTGMGFLALVVASIVSRVVTELMVVIFEIHSELQDLNEKFESGAPAQSPTTTTPHGTQPGSQPTGQTVQHHQ